MAKRRLLDLMSQSNHPIEALLLSLLLILISSISINCASFDWRPRSRQSKVADSDLLADSLIGQWATSPLSDIGYLDYPSSSQVDKLASPIRGSNQISADDWRRIHNQLQSLADHDTDNVMVRPTLAFDNNDANRLAYEPYQLVSSNYDPAYRALDSSTLSSAGHHAFQSGDTRKELLEFLSQSGNTDEADDQTNGHLSEDYQFLSEPNPKQYISIYQSLDKIADDETPLSSSVASLGSANSHRDNNNIYAYQVEREAKTPETTGEKRSSHQQADGSAISRASNVSLTTLLEDEDEGLGDKGEADTSEAMKMINSTSSIDRTTTVSYGKVVTSNKDNHRHDQQTGDKIDANIFQTAGSMLSGLYSKISNSWPVSLIGSSTSTESSNHVTRTEKTEQQKQLVEDQTTGTSKLTKPSVSELTRKLDAPKKPDVSTSTKEMRTGEKEHNQEHNKWSMMEENNDKLTTLPNSNEIEQETASKDFDVSESSERSIRVRPGEHQNTDTSDHQQETSSFGSSKRETKQMGGQKMSLLRQSTNLMMPFTSNDELISVKSSDNQEPSLFGKYIYAPEHHYHLSTAAANDIIESGDNNGEQMFAKVSQRSGITRNIHPGDSLYPGPFNALRPFYSASHLTTASDLDRTDRLALNVNKSNDIYFLVLVAAFCSMAMAVVLAAGLFAYRVQQSRKSSAEADYPTYGVVGPNNMSGLGPGGGKCGAASFVGGYFAGITGPGSSSSCSKSGSVKQLADMYSIGADSGISANGASVKSASGKRVQLANDQLVAGALNNNGRQNRFANQNAARMFHYQHQKQQMINSDRSSNGRHTSASDLDSEDENDENSYTVYECPGLASAHEMEIKNPLFNDDQTP